MRADGPSGACQHGRTCRDARLRALRLLQHCRFDAWCVCVHVRVSVGVDVGVGVGVCGSSSSSSSSRPLRPKV